MVRILVFRLVRIHYSQIKLHGVVWKNVQLNIFSLEILSHINVLSCVLWELMLIHTLKGVLYNVLENFMEHLGIKIQELVFIGVLNLC